jgi:hypothetical protein
MVFAAAVALSGLYCSAAPAKPVKVAAPVLPAIWSGISQQEQLKAERAAQVDAYRALAERIYGFRLEGGTLVWDAACSSDELRSKVRALVKGAKRTAEAEYTEDGVVEVCLAVTLRRVIETIESTLTKDQFSYRRELLNQDTVIEARGYGVVAGSKAQKMVCARRAAQVDAQRLMGERIMGVHIRGETTVREFCLQNDQIRACVDTWMRGLEPIAIRDRADGTCEVDMQLTLRTIIETVETLIERRKSLFRTTTEITQKTETKVEDEVFTVTGRGTESSALATVGTVDQAIEAAETGDVLRLKTVETRRTDAGPVLRP